MGFFKSIGKAAGNIAGGIASSAGNIVSGVVGAKTSADNTKDTNKANAAINKQNIDFNREQNEITRQREDTAHQREMADLESAGINPLMTLSGGNGAPTSMGLGAPGQIPMVRNDVGNIISGIGASAMENMKKSKEIEKLQTEVDYARLTMEDRVLLANEQLNQIKITNDETKAKIYNLMTNTEEIKNNMLLQNTQMKLNTAKTNTERIIAAKETAMIALINEQADLTEQQTRTEGFKQSESAGRAMNLIQEAKVNKALAEKLSKEIENFVQKIKMDEINLKYLTAEKVMGLVGKGSQSLRDILVGLGIGGKMLPK